MADSKNDTTDPNELPEDEALALAVERSNVSKEDFDPSKPDFPDADKVVELPDRGSVFVKDLVDHDDPVIAADAQAAVDGSNPGGPNWPNGPADQSADTPAAAPAASDSAAAKPASDSSK